MNTKTDQTKYIGITIGLQSDNESMWINGIKQNALFLANALQHAGHKVILLDTSDKVDAEPGNSGKISDDKVIWDSIKFPIHKFIKEGPRCDVLIQLGTTLPIKSLQYFKRDDSSKKIIKYMCGNNYVIDMERTLFGDSKASTLWKSNNLIDECWYVPQQGYQNHEYYRVLMGLEPDKVKPVPFVWDPMFIDQIESLYNKEDAIPIYQPKENSLKKLCIFEPNMNVVKYSMIPLLIIEDADVKYNIEYDTTTLIGGNKLPAKSIWSSTINSTKMIKHRITTSPRLPVHAILAHHADIIVSHQWENPLNYAYLDCLYLQFPLIHNAEMIKDAGYYYPDFNIGKGANKLKWVLDHHDSSIDIYNERNEEVLTRYTVYNEGMLDLYNKLLINLFDGKNTQELSYIYDWKTNLYK